MSFKVTASVLAASGKSRIQVSSKGDLNNLAVFCLVDPEDGDVIVGLLASLEAVS